MAACIEIAQADSTLTSALRSEAACPSQLQLPYLQPFAVSCWAASDEEAENATQAGI